MQYDPIKRSLGVVFNRTPFLRKTFYRLLEILLLRTWHVKKELRQWAGQHPDKARILDAGSGFGQYSFYLSGRNPEWIIDAIDVKKEQIDNCTAFFNRIGRKNVSFETADLTLFSRPGLYDLVLSVDVMEHIEEDEEVLRNFHVSLAPRGMLLISTPSDQGGSDVHDQGSESSFIDEHVRDGYNIDDIRVKLGRAGFSRTEARYQYGKPGQLGWRLSMKYPIRMLNASKLFFILLPFYYLIAFPVALVCNWLDIVQSYSCGTGLIIKAWK